MYSFDSFIGNDQIIKSLRNAIASGRAAHAYIICGGEGSGTTALAKTIAKTVQCERRSVYNTDPCMSCVSCRTFDSGSHPDVINVLPTNRKSVGVEDVREQINKSVCIKPYKYDHKIYIIKDADTMTPAAQNALLKTLEEPAGYGFFLLTSKNLAGFLPTVLSRCVVVKLRPVADALIKEYLIAVGFTEEDAELYSFCAHGGVGTALKRRNDENFIAARELAIETVYTRLAPGVKKSPRAAFEAAALFEPFKDNIQEVLDMLSALYRDILVYKTTGDESLLTERGRAKETAAAAAGASVKDLIKKLDAVRAAGIKLNYNANFTMTMDMLALSVMEA